MKNLSKINSVVLGGLFGIYIGADFFLHIFLPMIGYSFYEWTTEVAYGLFLPGSNYFERLSATGLLVATLFGLVWGFISGYFLGLIYNVIISKINRSKQNHNLIYKD